jgi:hypothetical protein
MKNNSKRKAAGGVKTMSAANEVMQANSITMETCPKFQTCSVPICPLDPDWRKRKHFAEDRICPYLLEHSKAGAKAVFMGAGRGYLYQAISKATPAIRATYSRIDKAYIRASLSGSRMGRKIGGENG